MANALGEILEPNYNISFTSKANLICCAPHAFNRIVQTFLAHLKMCDLPNVSDYFTEDPESMALFNAEKDEFLLEVEGEEKILNHASEDDRKDLQKVVDMMDPLEFNSPPKKVGQ